MFGRTNRSKTDKVRFTVVDDKEKAPQSLENEVSTSMLDTYKDNLIPWHIQDGDSSIINALDAINIDKLIKNFQDRNHSKVL